MGTSQPPAKYWGPGLELTKLVSDEACLFIIKASFSIISTYQCRRHHLATFCQVLVFHTKIHGNIRQNVGQKLRLHTHAVMVVVQVLARDPKLVRESSEDSDGGDFATRTFFKSIFLFADNNDKGELVVEDLETLFQVIHHK